MENEMENRLLEALESLKSKPDSFRQQLDTMKVFRDRMEKSGVDFQPNSFGLSLGLDANSVPRKLSSLSR